MTKQDQRLQGTEYRHICPICDSANIADLWRIPFSRTEQYVLVNNANTNMLPLLDSKGPIFAYTECKDCESIFLNPYPEVKASYAKSDLHAKKFAARAEWNSYVNQYMQWMQAYTRTQDTVFFDAGCGGGQYLVIAASNRPWSRIMGVDLSEACVAGITASQQAPNITAQVVDLDKADALADYPGKETVDFAILSEVFEHVSYPRIVIENIASTLKPGGRFFVTAQATEGKLPVRPGEPIYASRKGFENLMGKHFSKTILLKEESGKWKAVFEK